MIKWILTWEPLFSFKSLKIPDMKLIITCIELRSPFGFFTLARMALDISRQLKKFRCVQFRKKGFWTKHYTMTLWQSEEGLREFAHSGEHLKAMKMAGTIAREVRTVALSVDEFPKWDRAIGLLEGRSATSHKYSK